MSARTIDWRFLLPAFSGRRIDHLILLGGTSDIERTILDLGVATRVSRSLETGDTADAVVGLAGARAPLSRAADLLNENGLLYWEIDRRRLPWVGLTPGRLQSQLSRLGLNVCASYWVTRNFSRPLMYLPIDCEGALSWYLRTLFRTPTWRRNIARRMLSAAAPCFSLSSIAPCYAITAVRGNPALPALVAHAAEAGLPVGANDRAVLFAHGTAEWNRVIVFLFGRDGQTPYAVIKLPRTGHFNRETEWEHEALRAINRDLPVDMAETVPKSTIVRWNGLAAAVETCVEGVALNSGARPAPGDALSDLRRVVDWLAAFHQQTTIARVPAKEWARGHLARLRDAYAETFGLTQSEASMFDGINRAIDDLGDDTLPIAWQHADLGPPNVYIHGRRVSAIDWETARHGAALQDLLYFVTDWTAGVTGRTSSAALKDNFSALFCSQIPCNEFFSGVHAAVAEYMRRLGIAPSLFQILLVSTFVDKALERVRRLKTLGHPCPGRREGNRFVGFVEILAAHAQQRRMRFFTAADVSVCIATLDRPLALNRCMEALLAARVRPGEVVIVDQSRGESTALLVGQSHWNDRVRIRYVRQRRHGLAASRNAAISHAARRIVAFTDDDCQPGEGWLEALVDAFNSAERPDAVTGRVLPLGPERPGFYAVSQRASNARAIYRERTCPWRVGSGGNTAVTHEWLERIGGFDERLGAGSPGRSAEDIDLLYRLLHAGAAVMYEPDAVVYHERKDRKGRLATRPAYGFGLGTFCALSARRRDAYAMWMLTHWSYDRVRALLAGCVRRQWTRVHEESLMLRGAADGFARAMVGGGSGLEGSGGSGDPLHPSRNLVR